MKRIKELAEMVKNGLDELRAKLTEPEHAIMLDHVLMVVGMLDARIGLVGEPLGSQATPILGTLLRAPELEYRATWASGEKTPPAPDGMGWRAAHCTEIENLHSSTLTIIWERERRDARAKVLEEIDASLSAANERGHNPSAWAAALQDFADNGPRASRQHLLLIAVVVVENILDQDGPNEIEAEARALYEDFRGSLTEHYAIERRAWEDVEGMHQAAWREAAAKSLARRAG